MVPVRRSGRGRPIHPRAALEEAMISDRRRRRYDRPALWVGVELRLVNAP
jgi:hypothetical protein